VRQIKNTKTKSLQLRAVNHLFFLLVFFTPLTYCSPSTFDSQNIFSDRSVGLVNSIYQGKETIWLGTENGLVSLFGTRAHVFDSSNSALSEEKVFDVLEDEFGRVWLATYGGGIFIFDPLTLVMLNITEKDGLVSDNCFDLAISRSGKIYAACHTGLASIDIHSLKTEDVLAHIPEHKLNTGSILNLAIDANDDIWFSRGNQGVFVYSAANNGLANYNTENAQLKGVQVKVIHVDRQNELWIGTELGLNKWDQTQKQFNHFPYQLTNNSKQDSDASNDITSIFEDSSGVIWVGAKNLLMVNHSKQTVEHSKQMYPQLQQGTLTYISDIAESSNGELLVSSLEIGLSTLPANRAAITYENIEKNGLTHIMTTAVVDEDHILLGELDGLYSYRLSTRQLRQLKTNIGEVTSISEMENDIYVATSNKRLFVVTKSDLSVKELELSDTKFLEGPDTVITGLITDTDGNLLILVYGANAPGVYTGSLDGPITPIITDIHPTQGVLNQAGELLVATFGQGQFIVTNGTWRPLANNQPLQNLMGRCQYEDQNTNIWICTSNGLMVLESGHKDYKIVDPALTNNAKFINDIIQDSQGYFWITTNKGLIRYDHANNSSILLGKEEGIIDTDFQFDTALNLSNNRIFIVGDRKNYILDSLEMNKYLDKRISRKTSVFVEDMVVSERTSGRKNHKNIEVNLIKNGTKTGLELNYDEYLFTLRFTTNNYHERSILGYEYRLQGLNDEWITASSKENFATYTTLPAGNYKFQVRVRDPKSQSIQPITNLPIKMYPPLWLTWQAKTLYTTLLASILIFIYWFRTRQLKIINLALEKAVSQRTTELQKSNRYISNLLEQKQHLFANVSHEIRTPLSLIIGPLEVLLDRISDPNLFQQASLINRNAKRLQNLVEQILELEKLETFNEPNKKRYILPEALKLIVESFSPYADSRGQKLISNIEDSTTLELIEDSFEKIITNLLSNAIKYTPEGGVINVTTELTHNCLIIRVIDSGMGIEANQLENIFERFTRLQTTKSIQGTGIGLALVKELVKANLGKISVTSEIGKGSTFTLELPISSIDKQQSLRTLPLNSSLISVNIELERAPKRQSVIQETTERETLLIIEDNLDMRNFIMSCLDSEYYCLGAENGQAGLTIAINTIPELIISDLMMPKMDGFELAKNIRNHETTSHIPLILLTAKGDDGTRLKGWKNDIDDYITKPFNVNELRLRIARLISIRKILKKRYSREIFQQVEQPKTEQTPLTFQSVQDQKFYDRFRSLIEEHYMEENLSRSIAAEKLAISERQLNRKLAALVDYNFSEFLRKYRLEKAKTALLEGHQITEVSYTVGFSSPSYFSTCFKAEFGVSPANFISQR
jgi:signal transduction histidine kinase/ligand-binding sensor domain-containing protein/DNA-binding response OmpR family regulator